MTKRFEAQLACAAVTLALASVSSADDAGIPGLKLVLLDKNSSAGKSKVVYIAKGDPGIHKGAAGDPSLLSGTFDWSFSNMSGPVNGSFDLPAALWTTNDDGMARFFNPDAPAGGTCTKVAIVKPGVLAKLSARCGGDDGSGNFDAGGPDFSNGILTVFTVTNGNDATVHRMCTKWAFNAGSTVVYKEIAGGTGRKLSARNGIPTTCPSITTTSTTTTSTTSTTCASFGWICCTNVPPSVNGGCAAESYVADTQFDAVSDSCVGLGGQPMAGRCPDPLCGSATVCCITDESACAPPEFFAKTGWFGPEGSGPDEADCAYFGGVFQPGRCPE